MDTLSAIAASGMRARMQELDILANNLANTSSSGYKSDREMYSLYTGKERFGRRERGAADSVDQIDMDRSLRRGRSRPPAILRISRWSAKDSSRSAAPPARSIRATEV